MRKTDLRYTAVRDKDTGITCSCHAGQSVTVSKLQVGLLGDARRLQKQLDRIAGRADTNTPSGLHYILQGECSRSWEHVKLKPSVLRWATQSHEPCCEKLDVLDAAASGLADAWCNQDLPF